MPMLCLILFLSVTALWFFTNEYNTLFGVYRPACAMRAWSFNCLLFVGLLSASYFSTDVRNSTAAALNINNFDNNLAMLALLLALIVLVILKFLGIRGSATYAVLGSLMAYGVITDADYHLKWNFIASYIAAPVIAFIISAAVRYLLKVIFSKARIHLITMSYYMRIAIILCITLTIVSLGLNWGGMLLGIGCKFAEGKAVAICSSCIIAGIMLITRISARTYEQQNTGIYADFSIYAIASVGFSVAATLMIFSFESITGLAGISPVPLSVPTLVICAIAGTEIIQKTRLISNSDYIKEGIASITAPGFAFIFTYLVLDIMGEHPADGIRDLTSIAASLVILAAISFAGYARRQQMLKKATERLVYTQQQQIYENSRALNDMELKVVISENQALHNAVEMKKQEVMNIALSIVEQKEYLQSLNEIVKKLSASNDEEEKNGYISEISSSLRQRISYNSEIDSQYFYAQAESLHEDFNAKLSENFPHLTQQEKRLATLLRLGFSSKYIATLMNITPKSVEISRYRLRQKLGLGKGDNLVNFIKSI